LSLAVAPDGKQLALGRYDGTVQLLDVTTGKARGVTAGAPDPALPLRREGNAGNSPATGQKVTLPARIAGSLDRAGDVDYYRFEVRQGQSLGIQVVTA